ncbi:MAG: 3-oxoacyl-ACP reductase FabG [Deinococcus sp.]|nr:3-oxoacyl-ACP reductase FabG [Deinococcus sp.]
MGRLDGKVALVTGASSGIGASIAQRLAEEGANVVVHYGRNRSGALATARSMVKRPPVLQADLQSPSQCQRLLDRAQELWGALDIVVNNAAVVSWGPFLEVSPQDYQRTLDTNVRGPFFCTQAAVRHMVAANQGGRIINISSQVVQRAFPFLAAYTASKGALEALTRQLVAELSPHHITINCVAPGSVVVERNVHDDPAYAQHWGSVIPLGRAGQPEDIAAMVAFLASEEASWITGHTFGVDGGWPFQGHFPTGHFDFVER